MSAWMVSWGSVWRGIQAVRPQTLAYGQEGCVTWSVRFGWRGFWCHLWTPVWHEGRGPYVSIGLGVIAIYRGY